jgi:hypothetical protein
MGSKGQKGGGTGLRVSPVIFYITDRPWVAPLDGLNSEGSAIVVMTQGHIKNQISKSKMTD